MRSSKASQQGSKPRKTHKIEEYAIRARSHASQQADGAASQSPLSTQSQSLRQPLNAPIQYRALAVETHVTNEVTNRSRLEDPIDYSYDVRGSAVLFAPQRAIDMGLWASGDTFKIGARSGWYYHDKVIVVRKFLRTNAMWQAMTLLCVMIALFMSDFMVMLQVAGNEVQDMVLTIVLIIFASEFVGLCSTDASYVYSFFFWMDMIGTLSMVADISFIAGPDSMEVYRLSDSKGGGGGVAIMRAARAARLGARAGRLSRVLKIMKFFTVLGKDEVKEKDEVKMAKVISNQLNDVLATRVAFLTICMAVTLPTFSMFNYPEMDDSLSAWTQAIAIDAHSYLDALHSKDTDLASSTKDTVISELDRFSKFYSDDNYGPFKVCFGDEVDGQFACQHQEGIDLSFDTAFETPARKASIWVTQKGRAQCFFNLETPKKLEAAASMMLIWFIIAVMIGFSMIFSATVTAIAVEPLERMLSVVREKCHEIFKFTKDLQEDGEKGEEEAVDEEDQDDAAHVNSEFMLLEKAVSKLAAIADLSSHQAEELHELKDDFDETDMLVLNLQGVHLSEGGEVRKARKTLTSPSLGSFAQDAEPAHDLRDFLVKMIPHSLIEFMDTWDFDSADVSRGLDLPREEAKLKTMPSWVAMHIICTSSGSSDWVHINVPEDKMKNFASRVESSYLDNPFHNHAHALDVLWSLARFQTLVEADAFMGEVAQFWILIAALGHDMGHEGLNNAYLTEIAHPFALTYNDKSPLENMHTASLFKVLTDPESNVFASLEKTLYKEVRRGIIDAILHTDIIQHGEMVKMLALLYQMNTDVVEAQGDEFYELLQSTAHNQTIINMLLHAADVSNPMKPWGLCQKLSMKVVEEFFAQGDLEKMHGIPVGLLNDRTKLNMPNSQIGFIEFLIAPMTESVVRLFPALDTLAINLAENMKNWKDVWNETSTPSMDALEKVTARVEKVRAKLMDACIFVDADDEDA